MVKYIEADKMLKEYEHGIYDTTDLAEMLYYMPAADVVEVVRCENCEFWDSDHISVEGLAKCVTGESGIRYRSKYDYCSRGEKRNG